MNNLVEAAGFALVLAFLWFIWPPLVLLGAGLLLILWANSRRSSGRAGAAISAAWSAARAAYRERTGPAELRRVA